MIEEVVKRIKGLDDGDKKGVCVEDDKSADKKDVDKNVIDEMRKEIDKLQNLLKKRDEKKGKKGQSGKKDEEKKEEEEEGQCSNDDGGDSSEDECWEERIKKQNKKDWKEMTREVKRVKDIEDAKHMFAVFGVKCDDSQTMCVLRQRLCVIALERRVDPRVF